MDKSSKNEKVLIGSDLYSLIKMKRTAPTFLIVNYQLLLQFRKKRVSLTHQKLLSC
jgi:hypothetical protein